MAIARNEPLASLIRIWDDDLARYGAPYQWTCAVRWLTKDRVELVGVTKALSRSQHRALMRVLCELGVSEYMYQRVRQDGTVQVLRKRPRFRPGETDAADSQWISQLVDCHLMPRSIDDELFRHCDAGVLASLNSYTVITNEEFDQLYAEYLNLRWLLCQVRFDSRFATDQDWIERVERLIGKRKGRKEEQK